MNVIVTESYGISFNQLKWYFHANFAFALPQLLIKLLLHCFLLQSF